ncbi:class I SAM-dependent methyltransferase [Microbulbifer guangxiensis]|uniref:class I SAM-dependent methyltransferase n=1 Tax=Microbulbifer guangxiensis TaxID=2904249 RepID=UPI001F284012|nr:class I SAM-dependent methyltransferase [Microbulbifer guangxiensis]
MALVWQLQAGDTRYEVRRHGASVRLYSNGVFHSQWNERDPLKGSLWELLFLPTFFLPPERVRSVLLLGVGGGALIRLLQRFVAPDMVMGVDLDPVHLAVARDHFGVRSTELVCADARTFVAEYLQDPRRPGFDLVIDDLFGHGSGEAERAVIADKAWCQQLLQLARGSDGTGERPGVIIANFGSRSELLGSAWRSADIREQLGGNWTAQLPGYENCVLAASAGPLERRQLLQRAPAAINPSSSSCRLVSQLRRLRC